MIPADRAGTRPHASFSTGAAPRHRMSTAIELCIGRPKVFESNLFARCTFARNEPFLELPTAYSLSALFFYWIWVILRAAQTE